MLSVVRGAKHEYDAGDDGGNCQPHPPGKSRNDWKFGGQHRRMTPTSSRAPDAGLRTISAIAGLPARSRSPGRAAFPYRGSPACTRAAARPKSSPASGHTDADASAIAAACTETHALAEDVRIMLTLERQTYGDLGRGAARVQQAIRDTGKPPAG